MKLEAVIFDVDFTLAKPGPDLGPEGYRTLGKRFGLDTNAVVFHFKNELLPWFVSRSNTDPFARRSKLNRVADEVPGNLVQTNRVG